MALLTNLMRRKETIKTSATTEIENDLTRLQRGNGLWIATAESKIGPFRNSAKVSMAVSKLDRLLAGIGAGGCATP